MLSGVRFWLAAVPFGHTRLTAANDTRHVLLGDVNLDGRLDLVCANSGQGNTIYLNRGTGFPGIPDWISKPTIR